MPIKNKGFFIIKIYTKLQIQSLSIKILKVPIHVPDQLIVDFIAKTE